MKRFGAIAGMILLSSCGMRGHSVPAPTGALAPVSISQMEFRSSGGREIISIAEVTGVDVKIYATASPSEEPGISASFSGPAALQVIEQLRLNSPATDGVPAAVTTGSISIHYTAGGTEGGSVHTLSIENGSLLEDPLYPDVTYLQTFDLNRAWVLGLLH